MHLLIVLVLGLSLLAVLSPRGKLVFHIVIWSIIATIYSFLIWIWLVLLDGGSWLQWFFGFAVLATLFPAILVVIWLVHLNNNPPKIPPGFDN